MLFPKSVFCLAIVGDLWTSSFPDDAGHNIATRCLISGCGFMVSVDQGGWMAIASWVRLSLRVFSSSRNTRRSCGRQLCQKASVFQVVAAASTDSNGPTRSLFGQILLDIPAGGKG